MTARGIDVVDVRAALRPRMVLDFYGWKVRRSGDELESAACPSRSDHSRRALVLNANTGRWQCFPCGTSGDLFDFIAEVERLSDFPSVLEKAAEIAGVGPSQLSDDERRARLEAWQKKQAALEEQERQQKLERNRAAVPIATSYWERLLPSHERGLSYLASRYVDEVVEIADCVRFDPAHDGSPSVPLYNSAGEVHNVVARRLPELGEPKTPGLYRCPSPGTLVGSVTQIESGRDAVVLEGVFDSITARLAWHHAAILGAHAAGNLPKVVQVAAPIVVAKRGRMLIVPHRDRRGLEVAREAGVIAIEAGLSLRKGTLAIVDHGHKDLNDAWKAGWRAS